MKNYQQFISTTAMESSVFNTMFDMYLESSLIGDDHRAEIKNAIDSGYIVTENFYDNLKSRYDKAKVVVKNFSDGAKNALEAIIDAADTSAKFITMLIGKVKGYCTGILTKSKDKYLTGLKGDKVFMEKIKEVASDKNAVVKELSNMSNVIKFYKESLVDKLLASFKASFESLLSGDKQPVVENVQAMKDFMNESAEMGHNVIQKLVHGIEKLPPFSWLNNLKGLAEKGIDKFVEGLNTLNKNVGAPELHIPIISGLLALGIEYKLKNVIKDTIMSAALEFAIPFVGEILAIISWVALFIAVYEIIHSVTSTVQGGHAQHAQKPVQNTNTASTIKINPE